MENIEAHPMNENTPEHPDAEHNNMASLLESSGMEIDFPKQGEIKKGVIASISQGQIMVSVGTKSEGMITGREYEAIPADILAELKIGEEVSVYIINPEDQNGNLVLSLIRAREEEEWANAEELLKSGGSFSSKVIGFNKGGLIVPLGTLRGLYPLPRSASHAAPVPPARRLSSASARW